MWIQIHIMVDLVDTEVKIADNLPQKCRKLKLNKLKVFWMTVDVTPTSAPTGGFEPTTTGEPLHQTVVVP